MADYSSKQDIRKRAVEILLDELGYDEHINYASITTPNTPWNTANDPLGRSSAQEVVSMDRLRQAMQKINLHLPEANKNIMIDAAIAELTRNRAPLALLAANKEVHNLLKNGYATKDETGTMQRVWFIHFNRPGLNHFMVTEALPLKDKRLYRSDLLLYINGIPLVLIEFVSPDTEVKTAYDHNLSRCLIDVPALFVYNTFIILSNGNETKTGSLGAKWEHYNQWNRVNHENEVYDAAKDGISIEPALRGMGDKHRLLDIFENFTFCTGKQSKTVAKNHQYLGVNNAIVAFEQRLKLKSKLGIFFHPQGSGKSLSIVFFAMKLLRKYKGNHTFVIVTDRTSRESQMIHSFNQTGLINPGDKVRATSRKHLQQILLQSNQRFIFTLVHKFNVPGEEYPELTTRSDIIVLVDEAHHGQYNTYLDNMRKAMPNANYMAFTGTPLPNANRTIRERFGDYVSKYSFAQSVENGTTVPLFYESRTPMLQLSTQFLNNELADIVEDNELDKSQKQLLAKKHASELEMIKREARLDLVAQDIVQHFPYRGYLGKAMVVSIDKYTAVRMHNKVQTYWQKEITRLTQALEQTSHPQTQADIRTRLRFMRQTEMFVVISKSANEETRFAEQGLDIRPHRQLTESHLKNRFQDNNDPFRLVFLCAKWLTGFSSATLSTLYLDKPMKNHTLMQTIARVNRTAHNKVAGLVIDYIGIFRNFSGRRHSLPVEEKAGLLVLLAKAVNEANSFLLAHGCDISLILEDNEAFGNIAYFHDFANKLSRTQRLRQKFKAHANVVRNLYNAYQPDTALTEGTLSRTQAQAENDRRFRRTIEAWQYLTDITFGFIKNGIYNNNRFATRLLFTNKAIVPETDKDKPANQAAEQVIPQNIGLDLRTISFEKVTKNFQQMEHKHLAVNDFKVFLEAQTERMLLQNNTRLDFAERLQKIIDAYNDNNTNTQQFFEALALYASKLQQEDLRAEKEELTEDELQIFDLLYKENLTKTQKQRVKRAAQTLLIQLKKNSEKTLIVNWNQSARQSMVVERFIKNKLRERLKKIYDEQQATEVYLFLYHKPDGGIAFVGQA